MAKKKSAKKTTAKTSKEASGGTAASSVREVLSSTEGLTQLGSGQKNQPSRALESFPFNQPGRRTVVTFRCTEFTCLCPLTGQPDYATLDVEYVPADRALESKSFKNYLWSFRDTGVFHEDAVNRIFRDLEQFLKPEWLRVVGHFSVRGGIAIDVEVTSADTPRSYDAADSEY